MHFYIVLLGLLLPAQMKLHKHEQQMVTVIPPKREMQCCTNQTKGTDWEMTMNAVRDILCALVSENRRRQLLLNRSNIVWCPLSCLVHGIKARNQTAQKHVYMATT